MSGGRDCIPADQAAEVAAKSGRLTLKWAGMKSRPPIPSTKAMGPLPPRQKLRLLGQRGDLVGLGEIAEGGHGGVFGHIGLLGDDGDGVDACFFAFGDIDFLHAGELGGECLGDVGAASGADNASDVARVGVLGVTGEGLDGKDGEEGKKGGEVFHGVSNMERNLRGGKHGGEILRQRSGDEQGLAAGGMF